MTIAGEEIKDFLKMSGHVGKKNVNMYHEAKGIQPAASGLSPQCDFRPPGVTASGRLAQTWAST